MLALFPGDLGENFCALRITHPQHFAKTLSRHLPAGLGIGHEKCELARTLTLLKRAIQIEGYRFARNILAELPQTL